MSTEFYNSQWQMPNEANKSKQANYSLEALSQGDFVTVEDFPFGSSQSFTISFWVYGSDLVTSSTKSFIGTEYYSNSSPSTQFGFALNFNNGKIQFYSSPINSSRINNFYTANNVLIENEWNHIILRYNYGTDYRIYHNNTLKAVYDSNWSGFVQADVEVQYNTQTLWMYRGYYENYNLVGKMAEFNCFGYALTDTATSAGQTPTGQVAAIYGDGSSLPNPMAFAIPPIAYYPLSDSVWNGSQYITANNAVQDYVFNFTGNKTVGLQDLNLGFNSTISYWVKNTNNTGNYMTNNGGTLINTGPYAGNEYYTFKPNNSAPTPNSASLTNSNINTYILSTDWVHWTAVRNGTGYELYANGQSIATATVANWSGYDTIVSGLGQNSLGMQGDGSNFLFWNTNLSSTEVETLYNYGSPIRTLASIPQSSNLKAWYKLDASEVYNSSTTEWTINDALSSYPQSFNFASSSGSRINCGPSGSVGSGPINSINGAITIGIWVNTTSTSGNEYPIMRDFTGSDWRFRRRSDTGRIHLAFLNTSSVTLNVELTGSNDPQGNPYIVITDGKWHHIVGVYNGTDTAELYIDGVLQGTTTSANFGTLNTTARTVIGGYNNSNGNPLGGGGSWNGNLSNAQIWNTNLISSEITTLYNNGSPYAGVQPKSSNLKGWWKLDASSTYDGTNWSFPDASGNSNTAASVSMTGQNIVNNNVSTLNGTSSGMTQANLVQSNLQTVAPYSKYAIEFDYADSDYIDLTSDINLGSTMSFSVWLKTDHVNPSGIPQNTWVKNITGGDGFFNFNDMFGMGLTNGRLSNYVGNTSGATGFTLSTNPINDNIWHHCFLTFDGSTLRSYIDGSLNATIEGITTWTSNILKKIGRYDTSAIRYFDGILSNMAVWNSDLTASQAREVYNEGLPSDLNTFSGPAPTAWWKLGEGVSYDGTYIYARDYIGNNHGVSAASTLDQTNIVNGVGTSLNGTSNGFNEPAENTNIVGNAPYSEKNAVSYNMQSAKSDSGISNSTPQAT